MLNLEHRIIGCELRAKKDSDGTEFDCYASAFHTIEQSYGTIIGPTAFDDTLDFFLREGFIGGLNHDWDKPIGKPLTAKVDKRGLNSTGRISNTTNGNDAKILIKDEVIKRVSIGFISKASEYLENADDVAAYWEEHGYTPTAEDIAAAQYGARLITKLKLYEYSPVTVAANSGADILKVRGEGAPAALQLDQHVLAVLAANDELLKRMTDLAEKRQAEKRSLSPQRLSQVAQLRAGLDALFAAEALQEPTPQPTPASQEAAHRAHLKFLEIDSTFAGV